MTDLTMSDVQWFVEYMRHDNVPKLGYWWATHPLHMGMVRVGIWDDRHYKCIDCEKDES